MELKKEKEKSDKKKKKNALLILKMENLMEKEFYMMKIKMKLKSNLIMEFLKILMISQILLILTLK